MDYLNDRCLCMHVYVWTFNISDPIQWQIFLMKTKHSSPCCNTVQLLCMIPMGHREWYCARLALAAGLNATQHGSALFLIIWSLHNQRHSGQLQISLETRGSLCSNNNDDNHFWNPPPKLHGCIVAHLWQLPVDDHRYIRLKYKFSQFGSFFQGPPRARQFISNIDLGWLGHVKTGAKNRPPHNGLYLLVVYRAACKFSHYIWTTSITAASRPPSPQQRCYSVSQGQ